MSSLHFLRDEISVVGWSCRLPGAKSPAELWSLLTERRCAISRIPSNRFSLEKHGHPRRQERGKSYTWAAGVLDDIWGFDPAVFGISPREAEQMDPQQRIMLQLAWEALEDAGIRPSSIAGKEVGVYVGASMTEYAHGLYGDLAAADSHFATGIALAVIANRISYAFDLHGPSMTVDTACSSSLVALNQAVDALRSGRIDTAIVGGVNVLASAAPFVLFSQAMMLSPTGLCRAFSDDADGFVRAEGGVVLVLRKSALAQHENNPIRGTILASDVNSDGNTNGISLPSEASQERLLDRVYSRAGIDPNRLAFVEAHGTGTPAGDPVEARAIGRSLGKGRSQPLPMGSVKTNIGHLEPASGLAGVIKALLALNHGIYPGNVNFNKPNPNIDFEDLNISVSAEPRILPNVEKLCAGVNSFGFGGTNAHVVVGPGRNASEAKKIKPATFPKFFAISAETQPALRALSQKYIEKLSNLSEAESAATVSAVAYHRDQLSNRLVVAALAPNDIPDALAAYVEDASHPLLTSGEAIGSGLPVAFVYSGNGSQWVGMGVSAYKFNKTFRDRFDEVDQHFIKLSGWSLKDAILADDLKSRLEKTSVAQPLIFAIQCASTAALQKSGLKPSIVVGHSVGEVAASEAAGILDLRTAVKVIYHRSAHQELVRGNGRMAAVLASREAVEVFIKNFDNLEIAAINSPRALTVVGSAGSLEAFSKAAAVRGIAVLDLDLDYPFHSSLMDPIKKQLTASLSDIVPGSGKIPLVSTVTGAVLDGSRFGAEYWWRNIREPIQFLDAIRQAAALGARCFVEIGPRQVLIKHVSEGLSDRASNTATLAVLGTGSQDRDPFPAAISKAIVSGAEIDAATVFGLDNGGSVQLPSYPWQQTQYHFLPTVEAIGVTTSPQHPFAGGRFTPDALEWHSHIDTALFPELADHKLGNQVVFPGTGFIEIALFVTQQWLKSTRIALSNFETLKALDLTRGQTVELMTRISPTSHTVEIFSRPRLSNASWVLNSRCKMQHGYPDNSIDFPTCDKPLKTYTKDYLYDLTATNGLPYGPAFRQVSELKTHNNNLIKVKLAPPVGDSPFILDPMRLDCCAHGFFLVFPDVDAEKRGVTYIPVRIEEVVVLRPGMPSNCIVEILSKNESAIIANYFVSDEHNQPIAVLRGVRCQAVPVLRHASLEAVGLVELPQLIDGALVAVDGVSARAKDVISYLESRNLTVQNIKRAGAPHLMEAWATTVAYEIAAALADDFRIEPDLLVENGRVPVDLRNWLVNLLFNLETVGLASQDNNGWMLAQDALLPSSDSLINELASDYPGHAGEMLLAGAISGFVRKVCREKAISKLPGDLFSPVTLEFYETVGAAAKIRSEAIANVLMSVDGFCPQDRALRVLQIGTSGLGSLTKSLQRCGKIKLTVFEPDHRRIESARSALARFSKPTILELGQSIPSNIYDLIIAVDGLYRLPMSVTLASLREALVPGGLLLAAEPQPSLFQDLIFGLKPDWFATSIAGFPVGLLGQPQTWKAALDSSGFLNARATEIVCGADAATFIVAEADPAPRQAGAKSPNNVPRSIAVADRKGAFETELSAILSRSLREAGHNISRLDPESSIANPDVVIHFATVDDSPLDSMELLSARCLDIKATAERFAKSKGMTLWFVFFGALSHAVSKVRPVETGAFAFARTVANEFQNLDVRRIDILPDVSSHIAAKRVRDIILSGTQETELQIDATTIRAVRVGSVRDSTELSATSAPAARLERQMGSGQRLVWQPIDRVVPGVGEVEIEVTGTGLNFRDLMWMLSLLPEDILEDGFSGASMGLECAGRVVRVGPQVKNVEIGDQVMALAPSAFSTHVTISASHAVKLPKGIPAEGAATIPVAFFTAYYSLIRLARLKRDEWVLIHGGAGGVGMAAIQIAQTRGARVIATAGSKAKRDLLRAMGVEYVFDSRSNAFSDDVRRVTREGVDVVLNSLAGEAMELSLACLRTFGRFVELGKRDYVNNTHMGLRPFSKNLSYFGVDLDQLVVNRPDICEKIYHEVAHQFEIGAFKPLPHSVFEAPDVADAFHFMQQSSHVGKIVVRPPTRDSISTVPNPFEVNTRGTHLITGAFGGFGLETAKWLVGKGVRHLVLLGRNGPSTEVAKALVNDLTMQGVKVVVEACDVGDRRALEAVLHKVKATMPPIVGIIHAAMVLEDTILGNLNKERLDRVLAPKVHGAENLDQLTRDLKLDYFVLFSTLVTLIGNAGQGNYVAANAFMEGLARRRRQEGLPALAIGWGPIADVGVLVRKQLLESSIQKLSGVRGMTAREGLELMAEAIAQTGKDVNLAVVTIAPNSGGFGGSTLPVLRSPTYEAMSQNAGGDAEGGFAAVDVAALLKDEPIEKVRKIVADGIVKQLAKVIHAREESISRVRPLGEIGLDSLMALELGMNIESMFGAHISLVGAAGNRSIADVANEVISQAGSEQSLEIGAAMTIAERHSAKLDSAQVDAVKDAMREKAVLRDGLAS